MMVTMLVNIKNVRKDLGTLDDFKKLINEAHRLNIKIIIDLPINHTSTEHMWFKEARSLDNPKETIIYGVNQVRIC
jgi:glycosidase